MAGSTAPTPPPGKGGSLLKNLNPKQKRMLAVVGVGAFLALIFLLNRRTAAPAPAAEAEPGPEGDASYPFAPVAAGGTDPSAYLGAQGEAIGSRLEEVGGGLQEVGMGLNEVGQGLDDVERGQGELGDTFMRSAEDDEARDGRIAEGLAGQNRQLKAIQKQLRNRSAGGKGGGKKGGGKGGGGKGKGKAKGKAKGKHKAKGKAKKHKAKKH